MEKWKNGKIETKETKKSNLENDTFQSMVLVCFGVIKRLHRIAHVIWFQHVAATAMGEKYLHIARGEGKEARGRRKEGKGGGRGRGTNCPFWWKNASLTCMSVSNV
jgi:hypothetical protein